MRFPINLRPRRSCKRCGLRYSNKEPVCPHCDGLSDDQVRRIRLRHAAGSNGAGRLLLYIAGLVIVVMVIYVLKNR